MRISEICTEEPVWAGPELTILEAAKLMRAEHVGCLVIAKAVGERPKPMGIVTDRDIVVSVVAAGIDPSVFTLGDVTMPELATIHEYDDVYEAMRRMRAKGVRRLPVTDFDGFLKGIVTLDDVISGMADELKAAAAVIDREQCREAKTRFAVR